MKPIIEFEQDGDERVLVLDCTGADVLVDVTPAEFQEMTRNYIHFINNNDQGQLASVDRLLKELSSSVIGSDLGKAIKLVEEFERKWKFQIPWKRLFIKIRDMLVSMGVPLSSVIFAVDVAKCPKRNKCTMKDGCCDSATLYQLFRRQNLKAVQHCYEHVDILTIDDDVLLPPAARLKPPKEPYTTVYVNVVFDRYMWCPLNVKTDTPQQEDQCDDHEAYIDPEDSHPALSTTPPGTSSSSTTTSSLATTDSTTTFTSTTSPVTDGEDKEEKEKLLDLMLRRTTMIPVMLMQKIGRVDIMAALGKDATKAVGCKGGNKTIKVDGKVIRVVSLYHPGKVLYDMGTFSGWCKRHGQQSALQDMPPQFQDASRVVINDYVVKNLAMSLIRLVASRDPVFQLDYFVGLMYEWLKVEEREKGLIRLQSATWTVFGNSVQFGLEASIGTARDKWLPMSYFRENKRRLPYSGGFSGKMRNRAEAGLIMDVGDVASVVKRIKHYEPMPIKDRNVVQFTAIVDQDLARYLDEALPCYLPAHLSLKGYNVVMSRLGGKVRTRAKANNAPLKYD
ncbi:hypothetical protein HDV05_000605, partial [Chytridiales sp. JEL 0842]